MNKVDTIVQKIDAYINAKKDDCHYHAVSMLWNMIKAKAASGDKQYRTEFEKWVMGETSTIALRELCAPFADTDYKCDLNRPHENAFMTLDSWAYHVKDKKGLRFPEITLKNGMVFNFSHFNHFDNPVFTKEDSNSLITVLDDVLYSMTPEEEPEAPIKKALQPDFLQDYTYDFFKVDFVKKEVAGA